MKMILYLLKSKAFLNCCHVWQSIVECRFKVFAVFDLYVDGMENRVFWTSI
jgi:hypothetical protein